MIKKDDNDKLWDLLGKARQPDVSPFFSRNVLRAIRQSGQEDQEKPAFIQSLRSIAARSMRALNRWTWQIAIGCTCAVALLISAGPGPWLPIRHHHSAPAEVSPARQIVGNPDYEVIKHLDELVADEESSLWLDDSKAD